MALALTHIWLLIDDMPRALSFYRDTLSLPVRSDLGEYVYTDTSHTQLSSK
jgi:hypothetical protein